MKQTSVEAYYMSIVDTLVGLDNIRRKNNSDINTSELQCIDMAISLLKTYKKIALSDVLNNKITDEFTHLINNMSRENKSNTPDFIIGTLLTDILVAFEKATNRRTDWYSCDRDPTPSEQTETTREITIPIDEEFRNAPLERVPYEF